MKLPRWQSWGCLRRPAPAPAQIHKSHGPRICESAEPLVVFAWDLEHTVATAPLPILNPYSRAFDERSGWIKAKKMYKRIIRGTNTRGCRKMLLVAHLVAAPGDISAACLRGYAQQHRL